MNEKNYKYEDIHKTMGKINNQIEVFRKAHHKKPTFIIISEELNYILKSQMDLMCQYEMIILNDEQIVINRLFGFSCFTSPVLRGLNFEIR
jgi:hypothetical protein